MLADAIGFVGRTAHGMAKAAALPQQQLEYFQLLHCRSAGIFTDIGSLQCHNILLSKSCFLSFLLSTTSYQNELYD